MLLMLLTVDGRNVEHRVMWLRSCLSYPLLTQIDHWEENYCFAVGSPRNVECGNHFSGLCASDQQFFWATVSVFLLQLHNNKLLSGIFPESGHEYDNWIFLYRTVSKGKFFNSSRKNFWEIYSQKHVSSAIRNFIMKSEGMSRNFINYFRNWQNAIECKWTIIFDFRFE